MEGHVLDQGIPDTYGSGPDDRESGTTEEEARSRNQARPAAFNISGMGWPRPTRRSWVGRGFCLADCPRKWVNCDMDSSQLYAIVPAMPTWQYWSSFGVLGILAFAALSGVVAYYWLIWMPDKRASMALDLAHKKAMQEHEIRREMKTESFLVTAEKCQQDNRDFNGRLAAVTERLAKVQETHAVDCNVTKEAVIETKQLVVNIARQLEAQS